jgi:hypothetical protein
MHNSLSHFASDICLLEEVVGRLHSEFDESEFPDLPLRCSTLDLISSRTGPRIAHAVHNALHRDILSQRAQITDFRVWVAYPFTNEDQSWTVLEWRQRDGTKAMAVFEVDEDDNDICDYITHYCFDEDYNIAHGRPAKSSYLMWNVSEISKLKYLFQAVQHILGVIELPSSDREKLYVGEGRSSEECPPLFVFFLKKRILTSVGCQDMRDYSSLTTSRSNN